jgi:hypothetical protein
MADDLDRSDRKVSRKAMRRLDDDDIDRILLRPERTRNERSWWSRLFHWLTKKLTWDAWDV